MLTRRSFSMTATAAMMAGRRAVATNSAPVLVELFTSQGCSSCPPADRVLAALARRPDVVAVAFHVDYWDYIGWRDPFAAPVFTRRQRDYATAFANRSIYTPQMVFNGRIERPTQTEADAEVALVQAAAAGQPGKHETAATVVRVARLDAGTVELSAQLSGPTLADLWVAALLPSAATAVRRGENAGRTLSDVNIVRALENLGPSAAGMSVRRWRIPVDDPGSLKIAAWVQDPGLGPVRAAAIA